MALTALFLLLAAPAQLARKGRIAAPTTPDWTAPHVPGQLLVKFSDPSPAAAATLAAQTGLAVQDTIPQLGIAVVEATEAGTNAELAATATALEASPPSSGRSRITPSRSTRRPTTHTTQIRRRT